MLRIKEGIDLKELEKFGFVELDDKYFYKNERKHNVGLAVYKDTYKTLGGREVKGDKALKFITMDTQSLDAVYDLIKADMVERI